MPSQRIITIILVLAIGYVIGAKWPGIAARVGIA